MTCVLWVVYCVYSKMIIILESFRSKEVICVYECQCVCSWAEFASGIGHLRVSLLWVMHPLCVIHVSFVRNIWWNLEIFFLGVEPGIPQTDAWLLTTLPRWCVSDLIPHGFPSHVMEPHAVPIVYTRAAEWLSPPHNQIYSRNWYAFCMSKLTKFPPPYGGGFTFHNTKNFMNRFIPHVYRARPTHGPWTGSKTVRIWPKIE